jgi:serine phosphatase RsbU (regulator of sigma subunit)
VLKPPSIVGEIALFCDMPRSASVVARGPVSATRLTRDALFVAMHRNADAARAIISGLGQRLAGQNASVALLSTAARALGEGKIDSDTVARLLEEADRKGPLSTIFHQVVRAIEAKRLHEMELDLAAKVQQGILPGALHGAEFSLDGAMRPARDVGGDFYDFFLQGDGRVVFVVGDVSGKGVGASLFAVTTRTALRSLSLAADGPAAMVSLTNRFLAESNKESLFVTLFVGDLDLATGMLTYCNAGHDAPFVLRRDGAQERLKPTGPAVGMLDDFDYQQGSLQLDARDRIVVFTDGVTDAVAVDGSRFGDARLTELLGTTAPSVLPIAPLFEALDAFGTDAEQFDDITCVALAYRPEV